MKMTFRWYGEDYDTIPLKYIKQIPGVEGVVPMLMDVPVGEVWPVEKVESMYSVVKKYGLHMDVIESVNVHEDIKLGKPTRDRYIDNYIKTIYNLKNAGVKVICYNFMPVFDWTKTNLFYELEDGSTTLCYEQKLIDEIKDPQEMVENIKSNSNGYELPGWEPERLNDLKILFAEYENVSADNLFRNLVYFLERIIPVCEECDIRMAIHPDDPPKSLFGLPRIITCREDLDRLMKAVDSPFNGITLCTGSLGANKKNDMPDIIRHFGEMKRIHFIHARNIKFTDDDSFYESAHMSSCGSFDMYEIIKACKDVGYDGYMRPDHGRMIWDEKGRPGYGLYDRAIGIAYLNGLIEAVEKSD